MFLGSQEEGDSEHKPVHREANAGRRARKPATKMFSGLPVEVWHCVVSFLDLRNALKFAQCSKTTRALTYTKNDWNLSQYPDKVNGAVLFTLISRCTDLRSLNIKNCKNVNQSSVKFIIQQCSKLQYFLFDAEKDWDVKWQPKQVAVIEPVKS